MNTKFVALLLGVILVLATVAAAQLPTATIVGQVTDPTNAVVIGATVQVRDMNTAAIRTATTTAKGEYTVSALQPGTYEVTITMTGFRKLVESNLELQADQTARLDAKLEIGSEVTKVEVSDTVGAVKSETSDKGEVIAPVEINEMPLDGRDPQDLVWSVAGVLPQEEGGKGTNYTVGGVRSDQSSVMIEGMNNTNPRDAGPEASVPLDSLQEFKMQTSNYSAQYGRVGGAVVNMVMKRGGNQLHGSLFEFVRNDLFDASNYFDASGQKSELRRNQFGATVGGPVVIPHLYNGHDKTFFFTSWESYRQLQGSDTIGTVPSLLERGNNSPDPTHPSVAYDYGLGYLDFSQSFNVNSGKMLAATGKNALKLKAGATPNNQIPLSLVDPVARQLLNFMPLPNLTGFGGNNYRAYAVSPSQWDNVVIKIDQQIGAKDEFSVRALGKQAVASDPFSGSDIGTFGSITKTKDQMYGMTETRIFTPTLINEFRMGVTRKKSAETALDGGTNWAQMMGWCSSGNCPTINPQYAQFPTIKITGYESVGDSLQQPIRYTTNNYNLNDVVTWNKGTHTIKFGTDFLRVQYFQPTNSGMSGSLSSSGKSSNNALADFLTGTLSKSNITVGNPTNHIFDNNYAAYLQDDFKFRSNLTFNLGLRYELDTMPYEQNGQWSGYVPSLQKVIFASPMTPALQSLLNQYLANPSAYASATAYGIPNTLVHPNYGRFAPRVGFAWRPFEDDNGTVIRGGYGIFYNGTRLSALRTELAGNFPFSITEQFTGATLANPFPLVSGASGTTSATGTELNPKSSYLQSWNFTLEHEMGKGVVVELGYTGSKGTHLGRQININQLAPCPSVGYAGQCPDLGYTTTGLAGGPPAYAPGGATFTAYTVEGYQMFDANFGTINYFSYNSNSEYNAGTVTVRKQFSHGLMFRANYTFGKSIDDASGLNYAGNGGYKGAQNSLDPGAERGLSDFDRRHVFSGNFVYALPVNKTVLLRGWQLAGSAVAYSGAPFTPQLNAPNGSDGFATRPDRTCNGSISNPTPSMWFNLACFPQPTYTYPSTLTTIDTVTGQPYAGETAYNVVGLFGNSGRNILTGPGNFAINLAFSRNFKIGEKGKLQIRWEVFNVLNHPNFNLPDVNVDEAGAGTITKAKDPRVMQIGAKYSF
jgi:hypothetical protein